MADSKLYLRAPLAPGITDLFYISRADGTADGPCSFKDLSSIWADLFGGAFAPLVHSHAATDIANLGAVAVSNDYTDLENLPPLGALAALDTVDDANWSGTALALANGGTGATDASGARTALGVAIGSDVQGYSANLGALAGVTSAGDKLFYFTGSGTGAVTTLSAFARTLLDDADAATMRATLGAGAGTGDLVSTNNLSDVANAGAALTNLGFSADGKSLVTAANYAAMRTALGLVIGTNVQASNARLADLAGITFAQGDILYFDGSSLVKLAPGISGRFLQTLGAGANPAWGEAKPKESLIIACSDETTALAAGNGKTTFRMPYAFTVTEVRASLTTAQTSGSIFTVDINEAGTTILSTKMTIDNAEKTSTTAATAAVISDSALADDAEITIDIDQIGDGTAKGLKVVLIGNRT